MRNQRVKPVSVGRLMTLLKQSVGRAFSTVLVSGEVVDPLISQRGHLYFRLRDQEAEIKAVMWRRDVQSLRQSLQAGAQVTVRGSLDVYPARGDLQLIAVALMHSGQGQKVLQLKALKDKLKSEGLFDRVRRPLPRFPTKIGLVTSVGSAVLHDIYQSVQARFPLAQIYLSPASVSGESAPSELVQALKRVESIVDVVIIARGGGSFEELLPFSHETLIRSVVRSPVPVVAAVGHGSDSTLLDLVADHTAPTPTAAAVLVTPDRTELQAELALSCRRLKRTLDQRSTLMRAELSARLSQCLFHHPRNRCQRQRELFCQLQLRLTEATNSSFVGRRARLKTQKQILGSQLNALKKGQQRTRLAELVSRLRPAFEANLENHKSRMESSLKRLLAVGPRRLLERGFVLVSDEKGLVTSSSGRTQGEELELLFADGRLVVEIKRIDTT